MYEVRMRAVDSFSLMQLLFVSYFSLAELELATLFFFSFINIFQTFVGKIEMNYTHQKNRKTAKNSWRNQKNFVFEILQKHILLDRSFSIWNKTERVFHSISFHWHTQIRDPLSSVRQKRLNIFPLWTKNRINRNKGNNKKQNQLTNELNFFSKWNN